MKDKRTMYIEKLSAQIVEWDVQIERLKEKAQSATAEVRAESNKMISILQLKRDQGAEKLQGIAMATDDEWEDMKEAAEQIWGEFKGLIRDTIKKTG